MWLVMTIAMSFAQDSTPTNTDLVFVVKGSQSNTGKVLCGLYNKQEGFLEKNKELATSHVKPSNGQATCVFKDIAPGTYAVSFMHDLNDNGSMDNNMIGIPKEPWGMSQDPVVVMSAPSFDKCSFVHPSKTPLSASLR